METGLNKRQLQQILREMGVVFPSDASRDDLKNILDQAHQKQWLRLARGNSAARSGRVIRRRGPNLQHTAEKVALPQEDTPEPPTALISTYSHSPEPSTRPIQNDPPAPEPRDNRHAETQIFDRTQDLESYALNRANGVCDLCEKGPANKTGGRPLELRPCFFVDPPETKPHTVKTVAALCPECFERVTATRSPSDIKFLKRKARQTRVNEISITTKKRPGVSGKPKFPRHKK